MFADLRGYVPPSGLNCTYTLPLELHVEVDGEYGDAVCGRFDGETQHVVAVEGNGHRYPPDRPHAWRRRSAVEQAYKCATNLPCYSVVVTNIRQTRLYSKNADRQTYERFDTERPAADDAYSERLSSS